jgi:hypothetical protein
MRDAVVGGEQPELRSASRDSSAPAQTGAVSPPTRGPVRGAMACGAIGFACGAIFWHATGFWSFVSDVVLNSAGGDTVMADDARPSADTLVTGSLPTIYRVEPGNCTSLELDRHANRTVIRPCPSDGLALRLDAGNDREDLAVLVPGYEPGEAQNLR